ncbi:unnamed protein product [Chondrus crispus]|uniref:Rit1 N-terminal domain-containing protein n=1 Tax=Chondrus crispus TaxID=2769 RepID=R7Q4Z4_CHOCR|nr:unnamed protein product [Chondrus crispus]CDF33617.1 unnamed protein product [Chondrus crispus]|eukprot:XP_005713420.1 unnamed protein product [Chondrus crispus]
MKPLRPLWVAPGRPIWEHGVPIEQLDFTPIVCVSASTAVPLGNRAFVEARVQEEVVCGVKFPRRSAGFAYVQGAGDDEEGWCQGLTPESFWAFREELLALATGDSSSAGAADVEAKLEIMVEKILRQDLPSSVGMEVSEHGAIGIPIWKSRSVLESPDDRFAKVYYGRRGALRYSTYSRRTTTTGRSEDGWVRGPTQWNRAKHNLGATIWQEWEIGIQIRFRTSSRAMSLALAGLLRR